jgi:tRNA (mo5U34)-methyltransferase
MGTTEQLVKPRALAGVLQADPEPLAPADIRTAVEQVPYWYHAIDVGAGIVTPGWVKNQNEQLRRLGMPPTLRGMTVLDVGAWDGFYSFEAERRGAARVLATDKWVWERCYGMDGFRTAHRLRRSKVEHRIIDPHDISRESVGEFDVTIFSGVYYHLRDPLAVLDRLADVTRHLLIVESMVLHTPGRRACPSRASSRAPSASAT